MTEPEALERERRAKQPQQRRESFLDRLDVFAAALGYVVMLLAVVAGLIWLGVHAL